MPPSADLTRGPALLAVAVTTELLALTACFVNLFLRRRHASSLTRAYGLEDYAVAVAAVISLIGTIFAILEGSSMDTSAHALKFDWLVQPWILFSSTFTRISICLFLLRLVGSARHWRILLNSQILLMLALSFAFLLTTYLQCRPLNKLWDASAVGVCWNANARLNIGYCIGAFSVFWWLFLALFPIATVRDLQLRHPMRWPSYVLSGLCLIAAVLATVRTAETSQTVYGVYTFDTFSATLLSILEQAVGIISANVLPIASFIWARREMKATQRDEQRNPFESGAASFHSRDSGDHHEYDYDHDLDDSVSSLGKSGTRASYSSSMRSARFTIKSLRGDDRISTAPSLKQSLADAPLRSIFNRSASSMSGRPGLERTNGDAGDSSDAASGIFMTVEVDVSEEDFGPVLPPAHFSERQHRRLPSNASSVVITSEGNSSHHGHGLSHHGRMESDNNWTTMLRAGSRPRPPSLRASSRQGY